MAGNTETSPTGKMPRMPEIFVSHAAADAVLVDQFVDIILKLGCGLKPSQIFYSSGEDTGVPSGSDLIHHVREQVGDSGLVIVVVSPMFQTRPVCIAELGAAWSRTDNLFPLAVPGMPRTDMEGVLAGMTVRYLNDSSALDEIKDRVRKVTGTDSDATTWGRQKARWLATIDGLVAQLDKPETATAVEVNQLRGDLSGAREALSESQAEVEEMKSRIEEYRASKSDEERAAALLPKDEAKRFEMLQRDALRALRKLDPIVREAIYFERVDGGMPWPNAYDDRERLDAATRARQEGSLTETSDDLLVPDDQVTAVAEAQAAVKRLDEMLQNCSEDFDAWFRDEHGAPPQLRRRKVWDGLL